MLRSTAVQSLIVVAVVLIALTPLFALAQIPEIVPINCRDKVAAEKCGICDLGQLAQNGLNAGIYIAVFLSAVLFAFAGWEYMTAGGETGKTESAKNIFWNVGIGLVIILSAWLIVDIIIKVLAGGPDSKLMPWHKVCALFFNHFA